ncbi:aconitase X swivel domain-containing protein [Desulfosarcina sp.]|uniref:aconitase X swivel domain-containing protein n=1 Tax=Desulfosarcina sp. TaxID=2027861 RepID=UPI003970BCA3
MGTTRIITGRGALGGIAEGPAMISRRTITGWGGVDIFTGTVVEPDHPLEGMSIKDSVLILDGSKGSNGWSVFFHAAKEAGCGPAALVFPRLDSRTAVTAAVLNVPLVTDIAEDLFSIIRMGNLLRIDGDCGTIEIIG